MQGQILYNKNDESNNFNSVSLRKGFVQLNNKLKCTIDNFSLFEKNKQKQPLGDKKQSITNVACKTWNPTQGISDSDVWLIH